MAHPKQLWLVTAAALVLAPAGLRMLTWQSSREPTYDPATAGDGRTLFVHDWTANDALAKGGDGLGPVFNAASCAACHQMGGVGGAGGLKHNVTVFTVQRAAKTDEGKPREGVVHASGTLPVFQETLKDVDPSLPAVARPSLQEVTSLPNHRNSCIPLPREVHLSQRNTPALFGAKLIDEIPDRVIIANERAQRITWGMAPIRLENVPVGRAIRLADGRVGRFGWKGQTASLAEFVQAACANELGLGNPGQAQPRPLSKRDYKAPGLDLTQEQCNQLTAFVASLPPPVECVPEEAVARENAAAGKKLFSSIGCADCHTPNLGDVEGIYSDLLLHRMGRDLIGGGSYGEPPPPESPGFIPGEGPQPEEWRTPPLWGVADSAPYMHDGRAATLEAAIQLHGGQGLRSQQRFSRLSPAEQAQLIAFLKTLRAPEQMDSSKAVARR